MNWKKIIIGIVTVPVLLLVIAILVVYKKQDTLVQSLISTANEDFKGSIKIKDSHIAPFKNFPYVSINLEGLEVYETKAADQRPIIQLSDVYVGFDLWTIIKGKFDVKRLQVSKGYIDVVQYADHSFNLVNAFEPTKPSEEVSEDFHFDLQSVSLDKVKLNKTNVEDSLDLTFDFDKATTSFKTTAESIKMQLDAQFILNIIENRDTSFIKNKHIGLQTAFNFDKASHLIVFEDTEVKLEDALFEMVGSIDFDDDLNMDLSFAGKKPNFDLLIAFAPEELVETLRRYDNEGAIFFEASVKGKSSNGHLPAVEARFGCDQGFFDNMSTQAKLDELAFKAYYTNGEAHTMQTSEFHLTDFAARPDAGIFKGNVLVKNFESPEIEMQLDADFDLDFLTRFFNLDNFSNLSGKVLLTMNFHDIIDLNNPEKSLEKLNQAYFAQLQIQNLNFQSASYHLPIRNLNLKAKLEGNNLLLEDCNMKVGGSDFQLKASVNNVPAILHQTSQPIESRVKIKADLLDLFELTNTGSPDAQPVDEQISNLYCNLQFKGAANTFAQSESLPVGVFYLDSLQAQLKNYPHALQQIAAAIYVFDNNIRIDKLAGKIDDTDISLKGRIDNYPLWMADEKQGRSHIEYSIASQQIVLNKLFTFKDQNLLP